MMRQFRFFFWLVGLLCPVLMACEKAYTADVDTPVSSDETNVVLQVTQFEQLSFSDVFTYSRAQQDVAEVCKRINFAIYSGSERVKQINQLSTDAGFGRVALTLPEGSYRVLVVAHSSNGNPSMTDPAKVQFTNDNGFTDTFYYYGDLTVGSQAGLHNLTLRRAVSLFRCVLADAIPSDVRRIRFYYTGGSGALNAVTGYGCVNSKQTVNFDITDHSAGQSFDLYTFLHADTGKLEFKVTAYDANDAVVTERDLSEVPMQRNIVTKYSGSLFGGGSEPQDGAYTFVVDTDWEATNEYSF